MGKTLLFFIILIGITSLAIAYFFFSQSSFRLSKSVKQHGHIEEVLPNIYFVTGVNKTTYEGVELQHSRNMIIVRNDDELTLINTVRLTDDGLNELDALGKVKNVVRIGAFHDKDDAFYIDRYKAKLWAVNGMIHKNGKVTDVVLTPGGPMPFPHCDVIIFETSKISEGILFLDTNDGIIITCDSIKNWIGPDEYFSQETARSYQKQGFFGKASISPIWLQASETKKSDFDKLRKLSFKHLLSAHGEPLLNDAYSYVMKTLDDVFDKKRS